MKKNFFYLRVCENKHGNWGWVELWERTPNGVPTNRTIELELLYWSGNKQKKAAEKAARAFNRISGYGDYTG